MKKYLVSLMVLSALAIPGFASASNTNGTIDSSNKYAWSNQLGWINFNTTQGGITITDIAINGYAWSTNYGWINMNPSNGGVTVNAAGALSGYAWGAGIGWINFSGVSINSSGKFVGQATGSIIGILNFDCTNCNVSTDYVPLNYRSPQTNTTTSGGSSGGGYPSLPTTPNNTLDNTNNTSVRNVDITSNEYKTWFVETVKRADVVRDGIIDLTDFNSMMVNWNKKGTEIAADINQDGVVDIIDFNMLMIYWNKSEIKL